MKIEDIVESRALDEAPVSPLSRAWTAAQAKMSVGGAKQRALGKQEVQAAANMLWKYYQKELGRAGEQPTVDNVINFFELYNVPMNIIDSALEKANVKRTNNQDDSTQSDAMKKIGQAMNREPSPDEFYAEESEQEDNQAGERKLKPKEINTIFMYIAQKHKPFHVRDAKPKIPSDLIDQIKKLKPEQKDILAQVLNKQVKLK